jgi:hypothetical protein
MPTSTSTLARRRRGNSSLQRLKQLRILRMVWRRMMVWRDGWQGKGLLGLRLDLDLGLSLGVGRVGRGGG